MAYLIQLRRNTTRDCTHVFPLLVVAAPRNLAMQRLRELRAEIKDCEKAYGKAYARYKDAWNRSGKSSPETEALWGRYQAKSNQRLKLSVPGHGLRHYDIDSSSGIEWELELVRVPLTLY